MHHRRAGWRLNSVWHRRCQRHREHTASVWWWLQTERQSWCAHAAALQLNKNYHKSCVIKFGFIRAWQRGPVIFTEGPVDVHRLQPQSGTSFSSAPCIYSVLSCLLCSPFFMQMAAQMAFIAARFTPHVTPPLPPSLTHTLAHAHTRSWENKMSTTSSRQLNLCIEESGVWINNYPWLKRSITSFLCVASRADASWIWIPSPCLMAHSEP